MKQALLSLMVLFTIFGGRAHAGHPRSAGALIASVDTLGGFVPKDSPHAWGVRLYANGRLEAYQDSAVVQVAHLSQTATHNFVKTFAAAQPGDLLDPEADTPLCADAPSTDYKVYQKGVLLVVSRRVACHEWHLASGTGYPAEISLHLLEDLGKLGF